MGHGFGICAEPRRGETCFPANALVPPRCGFIWSKPSLSTAHAVGYRSCAAPRLVISAFSALGLLIGSSDSISIMSTWNKLHEHSLSGMDSRDPAAGFRQFDLQLCGSVNLAQNSLVITRVLIGVRSIPIDIHLEPFRTSGGQAANDAHSTKSNLVFPTSNHRYAHNSIADFRKSDLLSTLGHRNNILPSRWS